MGPSDDVIIRDIIADMDVMRSSANDSGYQMRLMFVAWKLSIIEEDDGGADFYSHVVVEKAQHELLLMLETFMVIK